MVMAAVVTVVGLLATLAACDPEQQHGSGSGINPTGKPTATVGPFELHIDPAATRLAEGQQLVLLDVVRPVLERAATVLRSPSASIVIVVEPRRAIPEVGVGGATDVLSGNVRINLDDETRPDIRTSLTNALPRSLAHELVHSARILDSPGPSRTLLDTIIDEGVADQFAQFAVPEAPAPPWTRALTPTQTADLWRRVQPLLDETGKELRRQWLFGGKDVPKWTAYTLGTEVVAAYRRNHSSDFRWDHLVRLRSEAILSASRYEPGD